MGATALRRCAGVLATGSGILPGLLVFCLCGALAACSSTAPQPAADAAPAEAAPEPAEVELNLSLPPAQTCACPPEPAVDHTFLERGLDALAAGDHIEAVRHFQRFQRLENTALASWESELAIAYISVLPASPFYDLDAARESWRKLQQDAPPAANVHPRVLLLRDAMRAVIALVGQLEELRASNAGLREDLDKREQALKRLRDLTLGQPPAARP